MKLDCVLIHVPKLNNYYKLFGKHMYIMYISMGIFGIADCVYRKGYNVEILHLGLEKIENPRFSLEEYLEKTNPEVVIGLSLHWHHQSYDVIETARLIKKIKPDAFIVLGGFTASYFHAEIIKRFGFIDAIIRGDGEVPFTDLLSRKNVNKMNELSDIPNLTWRAKNGGIIVNNLEYVADSQDLDNLNFTNLKLLRKYELYIKYVRDPFIWINKLDKKINSLILDKHSCFPLCITRGCDVNCSFCGGSKVSNLQICKRHNLVFRSVARVVDSIKELKTYGYESIHIDFSPLDNSFYFEKLFDEIKNQKIKIGCISSFRTLPSRDLVNKFCNTFEQSKSKVLFSPESASEKVRLSNKGYRFSNKELIDIISYCTDLKIHSEIFFVLNLPFQDYHTLRINKYFQEYLRKENGNKIRIYTRFLKLEPASPMYIDPERYNIVKMWNCFMDFYYAHDGKDNFSLPPLGFYPQAFFGEDDSKMRLGKNEIFKRGIESIYCRDYCRLRQYITDTYFPGMQNKFAAKLVSICSRFLCKLVECCNKVREM